MTKCVPIKEMKDTASFAKMVKESSEPIIVTKNGYEEFAVMSIEQLEAFKTEAARVRLYQRIAAAEDDIEKGNVEDGFEDMRRTREKYGL